MKVIGNGNKLSTHKNLSVVFLLPSGQSKSNFSGHSSFLTSYLKIAPVAYGELLIQVYASYTHASYTYIAVHVYVVRN